MKPTAEHLAILKRALGARHPDQQAEDEIAFMSGYAAGYRAALEAAAIAAWGSGMDDHKRCAGLPADSREVGSRCAQAIRALKVPE